MPFGLLDRAIIVELEASAPLEEVIGSDWWIEAIPGLLEPALDHGGGGDGIFRQIAKRTALEIVDDHEMIIAGWVDVICIQCIDNFIFLLLDCVSVRLVHEQDVWTLVAFTAPIALGSEIGGEVIPPLPFLCGC